LATLCAATVIGLAASALSYCAAQQPAGDKVTLAIKLPKEVFAGTSYDLPKDCNPEKLSTKPRPLPLVPKGTVNLALHKKVTSSSRPVNGTLDLVTDGDKEGREDSTLTLKSKLQWVQIDLEQSVPLSYILVWHFHQEPVVTRSVVVQVSDDPTFVNGVTTVFNNDQANKEGLGIGKDREYFENYEGRLIDTKGVKGRYVRLYSNGSTYRDPLNRYNEVEVYGVPSK
jgi:hypothetical protein